MYVIVCVLFQLFNNKYGIWERINAKSVYTVKFDTDELTKNALQKGARLLHGIRAAMKRRLFMLIIR